MNKSALELGAMAQDVADAKTIREFSSDRLKRAFSLSVAAELATGGSAAACEHKARASTVYGGHLNDLQAQYQTAQRVIEKYEAAKVKFESARSLLSVEKAKLGL